MSPPELPQIEPIFPPVSSSGGGSRSTPTETILIFPDEISKSPEYMNYIMINIFEPSTSTIGSQQVQQGVQIDDLDRALENFQEAGAMTLGNAAATKVGGILGGVAVAIGQAAVELGSRSSVFSDSGFLTRGNQRTSLARQRLQITPSFRETGIVIALPMPKSIKTNYGFGYEDTNLGGAMFIKSALNQVSNLIEEKALQAAQIDYVANALKEMNRGVADEALKLIPGGDPQFNAAVEASQGVAKTPYTEKLFKQVERRSFDFSYKFSPKNTKEMITLLKIIRLLKGYSHPVETGNNYYLGVPGEFIIQYMMGNQENEFLPKMGRLAMTSIEVNYGSEKGFSTFRKFTWSEGNSEKTGALPVIIEVNMKFTELEMLTRNRISEGY